ncbi:MAG: PQQ-binding-like beta-propeller repeat protein [Candidatus Thermoplasmatota archaeon]
MEITNPNLVELWKLVSDNTVWRVSTSPEAEYSAVSTWDKNIYFLDKNGKVLWKNETNEIVGDLKICDDNSVIYGSFDKNVYLVDTKGKQKWKFKTESMVRGIGIAKEKILAGTWDGILYFLSKRGSLLRKQDIKTRITTVDIDSNAKFVCVGSDDRNAYVYDGEGELLWKYQTGNYITKTAISGDGEYILIGSADAFLYLFEKSGKLLWKYNTNGLISSVGISNSGEYTACCLSSYLYFFDRDGRLIWLYKARGDIFDFDMSETGGYIIMGRGDNLACLYENVATVEEDIAYTKELLEDARKKEIDVTKAEESYLNAKMHYKEKEMDKALKALYNTKENIKEAINEKRIELVSSVLPTLEKELEKLKNEGKEVKELENVVNRCSSCLETGRVLSAEIYAKKGVELMDKIFGKVGQKMCNSCGKVVREIWKSCPYCKKKLV